MCSTFFLSASLKQASTIAPTVYGGVGFEVHMKAFLILCAFGILLTTF